MHRCKVSLFFDAESMLPLLSRSSIEAPSITSSRFTRYRTTKSGLMIAGPEVEGGWPLAPCPGETTSMMEGHGLFVVLHEGYGGTEQEILSLLKKSPTIYLRC